MLDPTGRIEHKPPGSSFRAQYHAVPCRQGDERHPPRGGRRWQALESTFRSTVERYGYQELRTPLLEPTELFVRSVGETTDIVQKEMFTLDHHGDS